MGYSPWGRKEWDTTEVTERARIGSLGDAMLLLVPEGPTEILPGNSDSSLTAPCRAAQDKRGICSGWG